MEGEWNTRDADRILTSLTWMWGTSLQFTLARTSHVLLLDNSPWLTSCFPVTTHNCEHWVWIGGAQLATSATHSNSSSASLNSVEGKTGVESQTAHLEFWFCCLLAVWPWKSCTPLTTLAPSPVKREFYSEQTNCKAFRTMSGPQLSLHKC